MKKLILIFILAAVGIITSAQIPKVTSYTMTVGAVTDTTFTIPFMTQYPASIEVNCNTFDAADAVIDLGSTSYPDSTIFSSLDDDRIPYTMPANSVVTFNFPWGYPHGWLTIKIASGTVTPGLLAYITIKTFR